MARTVLALVVVGTLVVAGLDLAAREAFRRADNASQREAARTRALPDAHLLDWNDSDASDGSVAAVTAALVVRPRDPRLLAAAAALRPDPLDDGALALAVEAIRVAPHAGAVADAVIARLLPAGEALAVRAVALADRAQKARERGHADAPLLTDEAAHVRTRALAVLAAVIDVDLALAPGAPGRAPLRGRAGLASRWRTELGEGP